MASDALPQSYEAYERLLAAIDPRYTEIVRLTLQFLCYSARLVTLREVAEAVVVGRNQTSLNLNLRFKSPEELLHICGGLVTEANGVIDLAHYSIKEYLWSKRIIEGPASAFFVTETQAHLEICRICLIYLGFEDFKSGPRRTKTELQIKMDSYPFLKYAAVYWRVHAQNEGVEEKITYLIARIWSPQPSPKYLLWIQIYQYLLDPTADLTTDHDLEYLTIHFPALWGLSNIVQYLLRSNSPVNNQSGGRQPLVAAVKSGSETTVRLLLAAGADPNIGDGPDQLPLEAAVNLHLVKIIQLLLEYGADVNFRGTSAFFPLVTALIDGTEEIVRILLRAGADIDARDESTISPLLIAVGLDLVNMVQILLHFRADTSFRQGDICAPLEALQTRPDSDKIFQMLQGPRDHVYDEVRCIDCTLEANTRVSELRGATNYDIFFLHSSYYFLFLVANCLGVGYYLSLLR